MAVSDHGLTRRGFTRALAGTLACPLVFAHARPRVVVAGGGFAGSACAARLRALAPDIEVTIVDPDDPFDAAPLSNEIIAGWREPATLRVGRQYLAARGIHYVRDRVVAWERGRVRLGSGSALGCDRLVAAPGIRLLRDRIAGLGAEDDARLPHAWRGGAQAIELARQLRAMPEGGVFAICVPAGLMRCPPAPFERASLVATVLRERDPRAKVLILDANNHFPRQREFEAAWAAAALPIEWVPNVPLERVDAPSRTLYTAAGTHRVAVANVIPPQAPGELAVQLALASGHGWCPIDARSFESTQRPGVFVLGDACIAGAMPKTASAAVSQATAAAQAIVKSLTGRETPPAPLASHCFAALSRNQALSMRSEFSVQDGEISAKDNDPGAALVARAEADRAQDALRAQAFSG